MDKEYSNNFIKKLLIIGGKPIGSVDIVKYAKSIGCYVIVCDYLSKEQSLAKQYADECWDYSTNDVDLIAERAKKSGVNAIFTGVHEFNIARSVEIAKKLNLPFYVDKKTLLLSSNKKTYKNIFKKFEISLIPQYKYKDNIDYPVLLKPADGSGAYGLQICNSEEEIEEKLQASLKYSENKEIILERYIKDKEEITTVYIIKDGIPYLASVADRIVQYFDNAVIPLPVAYIWNSKYLELYKNTIDEKMKKAIKYMGLNNGMLFIQSIVKDNIVMPYDIGFRLSGTQEHVIIESVCGYNPLKLLTDYALTGKFGDETLIEKINPNFKESAAQITFLVKPSVISHFEGLNEIEKLEGVIRIIKNKQEGETIPASALGTLNQVALRVFIKSDTKENLYALIKQIRNTVKIYDENSQNIVIDARSEKEILI